MNRALQPQIKDISHINVSEPQKIILGNGSILYAFPYTEQDVIRLIICLPAGKWYQENRPTASITARMLSDGTKNKSNKEIAEIFDFYGAFFSAEANSDTTIVSLSCLKKNFSQILPLLREVLTDSNFPKKQTDILLHNEKQRLLVSLKKVSFIARREFTRTLFPKTHPYGFVVEPEALEAIERKDILGFYRKNYCLQKSKIFLTGNANREITEQIEEQLNIKSEDKKIKEVNFNLSENIGGGIKNIVHENVSQSALLIGKLFPDIHHPDFIGLSVLNTILGGYFGSRLMKNIREDKGYTYGVFSGISVFHHATVFSISAEVKAEYTEQALIEINKEIIRLQNELISYQELDTVKKYMSGRVLRSMNGPFAQTDVFQVIEHFNMDLQEYIYKRLRIIHTISQQEILGLAKSYLDIDSLRTVVVGKKISVK